MSKSGTTVQFKYDHNGLRTQKIATVNGSAVTTNYVLHGKLLMHMTQGSDKLRFSYDVQSRPVFVEYNGTKYVYVLNLQGDIVALLDINGATMVEYKYDAWGKPMSTTGTMAATLGKLNPFRYRGYVYDEETGLYYLRSRYYSWLIGRFINVDAVLCNHGTLLANNAFAYCKNDSINKTDHDGYASDGTVLSAMPLPEQPPQEVIDLFTEFGVELPDTGGFGYGFVGYASYGWGTVVQFSKDKISSEGEAMVKEEHYLEYLFARPNQSGLRSFYRRYKENDTMQSIWEWKDKHDTLQDIFEVAAPAFEGNWIGAGWNLIKIIVTGAITDGFEQSFDGYFSRVRIRKTVQKTYYNERQKIFLTGEPLTETTYIW